MSALSFSNVGSNVSSSSHSSSSDKEKNTLIAVGTTLQHKLEKVVMMLSDYDSEDLTDSQFPSLNYGQLAGVVTELEGDEVVKKANNAYRWVITQEPEKQYFLVTDRLLGSGAQGEVYTGFTHHGQPCAVKMGKVKKDEIHYLQTLSQAPSEQSNVNRIIAADQEKGIVVMERADSNLSGAHRLSPQKKLSPQEKYILIRGILSGLNEIAKKRIIHSDIKPANIFVMQKEGYFAAKIGDFGLSIRIGDRFIGGTRHFYAPELFYYFLDQIQLADDEHMCKLDIWSAMLVFGELGEDLMSREFNDRFKAYWGKIDSEVGFSERTFFGQKAPTRKESRKILSQYMVKYFSQMFKTRDGLFSDLTPKTPLDSLMQKMGMTDPEDRISAQGALKLFDGLKPLPSDDLELPDFEEISDSSGSSEEID